MRKAAFRRFVLIAVTLASAGCDRTSRIAAEAGTCTISQPGEDGHVGLAAYIETPIPATDARGRGSLAVTLACSVAAPSAEAELIIVLPFLAGAIEPGEYRVVDPASPEPSGVPRRSRAFAVASRGSALPLSYVARGGTIRITEARGGTLSGAFRLAFTPEDSTLAGGLVLGGAFLAEPHDG